MADPRKTSVPVWTLATGGVRVPAVTDGGALSAKRLAELRSVLAALADEPIATLEVHPLPEGIDRSRGLPLDAASPLAQHLSQLIANSTRGSSAAAAAAAAGTTGERLYVMVVPAKVAAKFGRGLVRPMVSKGTAGGIRGALVGSGGRIAANATFIPVGETAAAGAVGGAGATAGAAAVGGAALTVAAPLVLMAVAVGVSAHAEHKREQAIERITKLLEQLREDELDKEYGGLDGCRDAIDKATAVLLDEGRVGASLGLDSAVHAINAALGVADRRLARWQGALDKLPQGKAVAIDKVKNAFPGIDKDGGTFHAHLELAALAIALKRRVVVLQAVEHAQSAPDNLFRNFSRTLLADQQRLDELESNISDVLLRLSALDLSVSHGLVPVYTSGDIDRLMRSANRIHRLGDGVAVDGRVTDVAIEIARDEDGSVLVFPARAAA